MINKCICLGCKEPRKGAFVFYVSLTALRELIEAARDADPGLIEQALKNFDDDEVLREQG